MSILTVIFGVNYVDRLPADNVTVILPDGRNTQSPGRNVVYFQETFATRGYCNISTLSGSISVKPEPENLDYKKKNNPQESTKNVSYFFLLINC